MTSQTRVREADPRAEAEARRNEERAAQAEGLSEAMTQALAYESAPAWAPVDPGSVIVGKVVAILPAEIDNQFGHQVYPKVIVETANGTLYAIHALGTVIFGAFKRMRTKVGDVIVVKFVGMTESKDGQRYRNMIVMDETTAQKTVTTFAYDWDANGRPARASKKSDDDPGY